MSLFNNFLLKFNKFNLFILEEIYLIYIYKKTVVKIIFEKINKIFFFKKKLNYKNFFFKNILQLKYFFKKNFTIKNFFFFLFNNIYINFVFFFKNKNKNNKIDSILILKSIWFLFRFWLISIFVFIYIYVYMLFIKNIPFSKLFFQWFVLIMFIYWLISGFVFFFKKYQLSKYTSVIQRFWKRTYILFWLIESGVFIVFFYLTLNASEESVFSYDPLKFNKSHLFSWKFFLLKIILISLLFFFSYFIILQCKWSVFNKNSFFIFFLTCTLIYILWLEFYQFFHIITSYFDVFWTLEEENNFTFLEIENIKHKTSNNYVTMCMLAKFWHTVFIVIFWFFFLLRINETKKVKYSLLAANNQNFIILYLMTWLYMYPWLKITLKPFFESTYYWFFSNKEFNLIYNFFFLIWNFYKAILFYILNNHFLTDLKINFFYFNFFYFNESILISNYNVFKKNYLKNYLIKILNVNYNE